MKRTIGVALLLLGCGAGSALAGEVYGKILDGTASVGDAATVAAKCGDKQIPAQKTDKTGSYHLVIEATGKCTLSVTYKGQTAALDIASYDDAVQYDVVLEAKDGKLTARRK